MVDWHHTRIFNVDILVKFALLSGCRLSALALFIQIIRDFYDTTQGLGVSSSLIDTPAPHDQINLLIFENLNIIIWQIMSFRDLFAYTISVK